jgi:hypothetical protein
VALSLREPCTLGVLSLKGGVGKTILAVHLAHYLHLRDKPVVLVDAEAIHGSLGWHLRGTHFEFPVIDVQRYEPKTWAGHWKVFDTPAHPAQEFLEDLVQILDLALVPVTSNLDSQQAARDVMHAMRGAGVACRTVINDVPDASVPDAKLLWAYLHEMNLAPLHAIVRRRKVYEYARLEGEPVFSSSHRTRMMAWQDLVQLGKELYDGAQPA